MLSFLVSPPTPPISITTAPDYIGDILQAAYVSLTLIIAMTTIWSVYLNRKQYQETLEESRKQSQKALTIAQEQIAKSERQAQAALEESRRQSQASIDTLHEQIELSKKQAQEELYNRFRPIIVCTSPPEFPRIEITVPGDNKRYKTILQIQMENVGLGVATDAWGYYCVKPTETDAPSSYSFDKSGVLLPRENVPVKFNQEAYDFVDRFSEIEGYPFYPQEYNSIPYSARLLVTYSDAFNNKYLSIFDYNRGYGWKQIASQKTDETLEELIAQDRLITQQLDEDRYEEWLNQQAQEEKD